MELEKIAEYYIKGGVASEAVFLIMRDFILNEKLFDDEFVFSELLEDYLVNELKNKMTFEINNQKYFTLKGFIFTYEKINKMLHRVIILKDSV
jgi:NAD-specific glutamate dehydrogenase